MSWPIDQQSCHHFPESQDKAVYKWLIVTRSTLVAANTTANCWTMLWKHWRNINFKKITEEGAYAHLKSLCIERNCLQFKVYSQLYGILTLTRCIQRRLYSRNESKFELWGWQ